MHFNEFGNHVYTNNYYGNLFSILIVVMLFALLYRMDIKPKCVHKIFAFVSGISLEIYLGLVIADKCAYILVEKSEPFIMEHQLSYAAKYVPWILGELGAAMFFAILVKYLREAVKRIFMLRIRGGGVTLSYSSCDVPSLPGFMAPVYHILSFSALYSLG